MLSQAVKGNVKAVAGIPNLDKRQNYRLRLKLRPRSSWHNFYSLMMMPTSTHDYNTSSSGFNVLDLQDYRAV